MSDKIATVSKFTGLTEDETNRFVGCLLAVGLEITESAYIANLEALVRDYRRDYAENLGCNLYTRTAAGVKENDCRCDSCRRVDELLKG